MHPGEEVGYTIAGQVEMMVRGRATVLHRRVISMRRYGSEPSRPFLDARSAAVPASPSTGE